MAEYLLKVAKFIFINVFISTHPILIKSLVYSLITDIATIILFLNMWRY